MSNSKRSSARRSRGRGQPRDRSGGGAAEQGVRGAYEACVCASRRSLICGSSRKHERAEERRPACRISVRRGPASQAAAEHVPILLGGNQPGERAHSRQHLGGRLSGQHRRRGLGACQLSRRCRALVRVQSTGGRACVGHIALILECPAGSDGRRAGHRGFFYHFLDLTTGRRAWECELSTIDTTILIAGALTAAAYFDGATDDEREVRELADSLYRRVDWRWAQNGKPTVSHGWTPEAGFERYHWQGYNEALILYVLGLGSPTHPLPAKSYHAWSSTYRWKKLYGHEFLYGAPLFMHQLSHVWIDFRGIQDAFMRRQAIDYFENSRRATYVNQQYAIRNPKGFRDYGEHAWGITASNGPGPTTRRIGASHDASLAMSRAACRMVPMTAPSRHGRLPRRCHSLQRSCCRPWRTVPGHTRTWKTNTGSCAASIRPSRVVSPAGRLDFERPFRPRSGAGRPDDRELSVRADLAAHAELPVHRRRPAPRGDPRGDGWRAPAEPANFLLR